MPQMGPPFTSPLQFCPPLLPFRLRFKGKAEVPETLADTGEIFEEELPPQGTEVVAATPVDAVIMLVVTDVVVGVV